MKQILNTKLFDFKKAEQNPGWLKEIRGQHVPGNSQKIIEFVPSCFIETEEYGISSIVFKYRVPFHPKRLHDLIFNSEKLKSVIRSKGFCWLATRMDRVGNWAHRYVYIYIYIYISSNGNSNLLSGAIWRIEAGQEWFATLPFDEWELKDEKELPAILKDWNSKWGDRRQEIVLIGMNMDKESIRRELEMCLLTKEEMDKGVEEWLEYEDPFEEWEMIDKDEWL